MSPDSGLQNVLSLTCSCFLLQFFAPQFFCLCIFRSLGQHLFILFLPRSLAAATFGLLSVIA